VETNAASQQFGWSGLPQIAGVAAKAIYSRSTAPLCRLDSRLGQSLRLNPKRGEYQEFLLVNYWKFGKDNYH